MSEMPAGTERDEQYVVLDLDNGEPQFPGRCVLCGQLCSGETQRLRSLGHFLGASRPPVVNRVFAVPVHRARCRPRLLFSWWNYRFKNIFAFALAVLLVLSLQPLGYPDSYNVAVAVVAAMVAGFFLTAQDGKMSFKILVWPDKGGAMSYVFWFKDVGYAREFSAMNRELGSKRHGIVKRAPG